MIRCASCQSKLRSRYGMTRTEAASLLRQTDFPVVCKDSYPWTFRPHGGNEAPVCDPTGGGEGPWFRDAGDGVIFLATEVDLKDLGHIWTPTDDVFVDDRDRIDRLVGAIEKDERAIPPIIVSTDGNRRSKGLPRFSLIDGYHRLQAARILGLKSFRALVSFHPEGLASLTVDDLKTIREG